MIKKLFLLTFFCVILFTNLFGQTITGGSVCAGNTFTISSTGGGTWSSGATLVATVNSSGVVTGVAAGMAIISYTVAGVTDTALITVNAKPPYTFTATPSTACVGTPVTLNASGYTCGIYGLGFSGTASASYSSVISTATDNVTMEAWVKWTGVTGSNQFILYNGNTGSSGYGLYINPGTSSLSILCGGVSFLSSTASLTAGVWLHIAVVRNTGAWLIYVNDTAYSVSGSATPNTPSGTFCVGNATSGAVVPFNGSVDEVQFWNQARSAVQIASDGKSCGMGAQPNLVGYWEIEEGTGATTSDASGNGHALTLSGTSWVSAGAAAVTYAWSFGDGGTSASATPAHTYTVAGSYTPGLTVTSTEGCSNTATSSVLVSALPSAAFTAPSALCLGYTDTFTSSAPSCSSYALNIPSAASATAAVFNTATDNITLEGWVNWAGANSANQFIFYNGTSASNGYGLMVNTANANQLSVLCGGVAFLNSGATLATGVWQHVAIVRNAGTWTLYIDSSPYALSPSGSAPNTPTGQFLIGNSSVAGGEHFNGSIDEVSLWTVARTSAQILADRATCNLPAQTGLQGYWKLEEGTGTTTADASGNAQTLTLNSATWSTPGALLTTYAWTFGDASTASVSPTTHTYTAVGTYTAALTVTNSYGCTAGSSSTITVGAQPTLSSITPSPTTLCTGTAITLTTVASGGAGTPTYHWTGPNSYTATGTTTTTMLTPAATAATGVYSISLTYSGTGCTTPATVHTSTVTVRARPTVASITPATTNMCVGATLTLTAGAVTGTGTLASYNWYGPGSYTSTGTASVLGIVPSIGSFNQYTLTVTYPGAGCISTTHVTPFVVVNAKPTIASVSASTATICTGSTLTLNAGAATGTGTLTYNWSGPNSYATASAVPSTSFPDTSAASTGVYSLSISTSSLGCTSPAVSTSVTSYLRPAISGVTPSATALCIGPGHTLTLTTGATSGTGTLTSYSWAGPSGYTSTSVTGALMVTPATVAWNGLYSVSVTYPGTGCTSDTQTTFVTVDTIVPHVTITGPASICIQSIDTLYDAKSGGTWSSNAPSVATVGSSSGVITPVAIGSATISYTYTSAACGTVTSSAYAITVSALTALSTAITGSITVCAGSSTSFANTTPGGTWISVNPAVAGTGHNGNIIGISGGTATISYVAPAGGVCPSVATKSISVYGPALNCIGCVNNAICAGNAISLSSDSLSSATYSWSGPNGFTSTLHKPVIPAASVTAASAGVYTVSGTVMGCTAKSQIIIDVPNSFLSPASPTSAFICSGGTTTLAGNATPAIIDSQYDVLSIPFRLDSVNEASGATILPTTDDGCFYATLPFTFKLYGVSYNSIFINNNGSLSFTDSIDNFAAAPLPVSGYPPAIYFSGGDADTRPVTGSYSNGKVSYLVAGIAPYRQLLVRYKDCGSYNQNRDSTLDGEVILYETTNVIEMMIAHCSLNSTAIPTNNYDFGIQDGTGKAVTIPGMNYTANRVYEPQGWRFQHPGAYNYLWSPATDLNSTTVLNPVSTGLSASQTYTFTTTDSATGCALKVGTDTIKVNPVPVVLSHDTAICIGASVSLVAAGGTTYSWSPALAGMCTTCSSTTVSPTVTTTFTLTGTNPTGCNAIKTITVTIYNPTATITSSAATICTGSSLTLSTASTDTLTSYHWSGPNSYTVTNAINSASRAITSTAMGGTYSLTATNNHGCISPVTTTSVTVNNQPVTSSLSASDTAFCTVNKLVLTEPGATGTGGSPAYSWSGPASYSYTGSIATDTILMSGASQAGIYSVSVVYPGYGCSSVSLPIHIAWNSRPTLAGVTSSDTVLCTSSSLTLIHGTGSGTGSPATYYWKGPNGFTSTIASPVFTPTTTTASGVYKQTLIYPGKGCASDTIDTHFITVNARPTITSLTLSDTILCLGGSLTVNMTTTGTGSPVYSVNNSYFFLGNPMWLGGDTSTTLPLVVRPRPTPFYGPVLPPDGGVTNDKSYYASVTYPGTGCTSLADTLRSITIYNAPVLTSVSPTAAVCPGHADTLKSFSTFLVPGPTYHWSGPGGYSSTTSMSNLYFTPATSAWSGIYSVYVTHPGAGCISDTVTTPLNVLTLPTATALTGSLVTCTGNTLSLTEPIDTGTGAFTSWFLLNSRATVATTTVGGITYGVITGVSSGLDTIYYQDFTACGSAIFTKPITINQSGVWLGTISSNWNDTTNWPCGILPIVTQDVVIPSGTLYAPQLPASAIGNTKGLTIQSGAGITLNSGSVLNVKNGFANSGSITGTGTVLLNGTSAQAITGTGSISNVTLNNSAGATISTGARMTITKTLGVTTGTLTTNDSLILNSDTSGTARITALPTGTSISGKVQVRQYIAGGHRAFRFYGHPFSSDITLSQIESYIDITGAGGAANGFTSTATNAPSAFWYNPLVGNSAMGYDPGWTPFTGTSTTSDTNGFHKYEGIRLFVRGAKNEGLNGYSYTPSPVTLSMKGPVNQGTQYITMKKGTGLNEDYNQLSNPYPSPVDIGTVAYNAKMAGKVTGAAVYIWNPYVGPVGQFVAVPITTGIPCNLEANASFQIRAAHNGDTLSFTENNKVSTAALTVLKANTDNSGVSLFVYDAYYNPWDKLDLQFNDAATDAEDNDYDAVKPNSPAGLNFYSLSSDNKKMMIDGRPYTASKTIPLGINSSYAQDFIIKAESVAVPKGEKLYLHDKLLQQYAELTQGAEYRFAITTDKATQGDNRFELSMQSKSQVAKEVQGLTVSMQPNPASDDVSISFTNGKANKVSVKMMDIAGVSVYSKDLGMQQSGSVSISLNGFAAGIYMVELTSSDEKVVQRLVKD